MDNLPRQPDHIVTRRPALADLLSHWAAAEENPSRRV
jgi:hypothetical protein